MASFRRAQDFIQPELPDSAARGLCCGEVCCLERKLMPWRPCPVAATNAMAIGLSESRCICPDYAFLPKGVSIVSSSSYSPNIPQVENVKLAPELLDPDPTVLSPILTFPGGPGEQPRLVPRFCEICGGPRGQGRFCQFCGHSLTSTPPLVPVCWVQKVG